jgi:cullin-associated NEDD8-dissociated protein 1
MIVEAPQPFDDALTAVMPKFLNGLNDADLLVRRASLRTLNAVAHRKPSVVRPHLKQFLPALYNESRIKAELIREIIVGPYKHLQDDGLDNRKAAFEVMFTLLENSLDLIDFAPFLVQLASGLGDNADIKALSQLMVEKLAKLEPSAVLAGAWFRREFALIGR